MLLRSFDAFVTAGAILAVIDAVRLYRVAPTSLLDIVLLFALVLGPAVAFGVALGLGGMAAWRWGANDFAAPASVLPIVTAAAIGTIGLQTMFGGIVRAIVGGASATIVPRRRGTA